VECLSSINLAHIRRPTPPSSRSLPQLSPQQRSLAPLHLQGISSALHHLWSTPSPSSSAPASCVPHPSRRSSPSGCTTSPSSPLLSFARTTSPTSPRPVVHCAGGPGPYGDSEIQGEGEPRNERWRLRFAWRGRPRSPSAARSTGGRRAICLGKKTTFWQHLVNQFLLMMMPLSGPSR
jgi:hypothetical protein